MQPTSVKEESNHSLAPSMTVGLKSARFLPWLVLVCGLAVTWLLWGNARQDAARELQEYFDFRAREAHALTEQRIIAQEQVLRGAQGLFAASGSVDRNEFRNYVTSLHLEDNYPGIQGVGFSLIIPPGQKARHIAAIRKESARPEYTIRPEGERDIYTSIIYLEPFSGRNLRAFGYDMYSEPVRRAAMERARDSGKASISGKVILVQETEKDVQAGFLMYLPVYRNGSPQGTVQERRANIIGWVYSPFRMHDLALGMYGERAADLDIEIYDGEKTSSDALMYDSDNESGEEGTYTLAGIQHLNVADHLWTLAAYSLPNLESRVNRDKPVLIAYAGMAASLLLTALTWLLASGRSRALAYARNMNRELIQSEQALHDSEEKLQAILNAAEVAIAWANDSGRIEYANPKFISMFGYTLDDVPTIEQWHLHAYPDADYRAKAVGEWNARVARSLPKKTAIEPMELDIACKDGSVRHVILMGSWAGSRLLANFSDITQLKNAEQQLRKAMRYNRSLIEASLDPLVTISEDGKITDVNNATIEVTGVAREQLIGSDFSDYFTEPEKAREGYRHVFSQGFVSDYPLSIRHCNGHSTDVLYSASVYRNEAGEVAGVLAAARDITRLKQTAARVEYLAHFDVLTDLPNRTLLNDRLQQALAKAKRDKGHCALMFLDLDQFKPVNDTFGHAMGDLLLREAAIRMRDCVRESDTVARIGGDEFVMLLPAIEAEEDALLVAEKIRHALHQPFIIAGHTLHISCSIGIAVYPEHGSSEAELSHNADTAMYFAKENGRNNVQLYQPGMQ